MFALLVFTFFVYVFTKNAIECSPIPVNVDSNELRSNLSILNKIDDVETIKTRLVKDEKKIVTNGVDISTLQPSIEEEDGNLQREEKVGRRKPKFFGSLGFLAGLSAANLANAASENVHIFSNILNGVVPLSIVPPGYFAGFYKPQTYLPYSYPVFYPLPSFVNNFKIPVNGVPQIPVVQMSQRLFNATEKNQTIVNQDDSKTKNDGKEEPVEPEEILKDAKEAAETREVFNKTIKPDAKDEDEDDGIKEDLELRQSGVSTSTKPPKKTTANPPTTTTTTKKMEIKTTTESSSNFTTTITSAINDTGNFPFYGYYGGSPQDLSQVILTTEDPDQRYLKNYASDTLPFERPAFLFNPYKNSESYSNPFANSFSSWDSYPEFLNTVDSDRYSYDSSINRQSFNGFKPIL